MVQGVDQSAVGEAASVEDASARITILLVDDEESVRSVLSRVLVRAGYNVAEASDGIAALEYLEQAGGHHTGGASRHGPVSLVITDMEMPHMRGDELQWRIRERFPDIRIMMLSAYSDIESAVACMRMGAADYVLKPFSLPDILFRVERALGKRPPG
jgi:CheY-like chemotaxis protein